MSEFKLNVYPHGKIYSAESIEQERKKIREQHYADGTIYDDYATVTGIRGDESKYEFLSKYALLCHGSEAADRDGEYSKPSPDETRHWIKDKIEQMSEVEFWRSVALSNIYWHIKTHDRYEEEGQENIQLRGELDEIKERLAKLEEKK